MYEELRKLGYQGESPLCIHLVDCSKVKLLRVEQLGCLHIIENCAQQKMILNTCTLTASRESYNSLLSALQLNKKGKKKEEWNKAKVPLCLSLALIMLTLTNCV